MPPRDDLDEDVKDPSAEMAALTISTSRKNWRALGGWALAVVCGGGFSGAAVSLAKDKFSPPSITAVTTETATGIATALVKDATDKMDRRRERAVADAQAQCRQDLRDSVLSFQVTITNLENRIIRLDDKLGVLHDDVQAIRVRGR